MKLHAIIFLFAIIFTGIILPSDSELEENTQSVWGTFKLIKHEWVMQGNDNKTYDPINATRFRKIKSDVKVRISFIITNELRNEIKIISIGALSDSDPCIIL